ncbi:hypothetical protein Cs7R123_49700 [Catellatospora sp. TT07R-123]|uniref:BTAD domain-containing putative transcriptional regulator n=1 Tax=Catellatospora sp. TT07R-123 TaxID=2733863 RepID=UPI001B14028F|nr:BTAD domain-containing putative transcriptional regulator [Catellatospora sp. TT07R-123]GHJ47628.1 hypothetical protein Cs7R123_49700 [Catellatospora sp. TT07R-123]
MQIQILGRVVVLSGWSTHRVDRAQTRGILALLALNTGRVVTHDGIAEAMWGDTPPRRARSRIHTAVSDIRRCFQDIGLTDPITSDRYGYLLDAPRECLDAHRMDEELRRARRLLAEGDHAAAEECLRGALGLCRGGPLADAAGAFVDPTRVALEEQRLCAVEDLAVARLALRRYDEVVGELLPLTELHPFRERMRGCLMVALHRSGRQAQALQVFREYRVRLAERDGLDPGRELTELADAIVQDRELGWDGALPDERRPTGTPRLSAVARGHGDGVGMALRHGPPPEATAAPRPDRRGRLAAIAVPRRVRREAVTAPVSPAPPPRQPGRLPQGMLSGKRDEADLPCPPHGLPRYRLLTGPGDATFCRRVSEALDLGYRLHGGASVAFDGEKMIAVQAVVWPGTVPGI